MLKNPPASLHPGAVLEDRRTVRRLGTGRAARNVQAGKLMLAQINIVCLVVNGIIETHLAVAVAMEIPETNVAGIGNFGGPRRRLIGAQD
jgi:hypothetical protein